MQAFRRHRIMLACAEPLTRKVHIKGCGHEQAANRQTRSDSRPTGQGVTLRVASRLADCSINTVTKLRVDVGLACSIFQNNTLRNLPCKRIQCDEIWSFVYAKTAVALMTDVAERVATRVQLHAHGNAPVCATDQCVFKEG
jgi:hypothetical protein